MLSSRFFQTGVFLMAVLCLLAPKMGQAQDAAAGAFSRMGFGSQGIALGNAGVATPGADGSPYYNPALAPNASGQRIAASAALMSFDRELQFLEFTTPIGPTAGIGVSLIHAGVSGIDGRDDNGAHTEDLSTDEFAFLLSFGNRFAERLSVGASLKLFQADFVDQVDPVLSFGLDLGATFDATEQLTLGLVVGDLLAKYEWNTSATGGRTNTDRFPVRIRAGASYALRDGRLRILGEVESRTAIREFRERVPTARRFETEELQTHSLQGRLGAAYDLIDILTIRAGIDRIGVDDVQGLRPSAGFGVEQTLGNLDLRIGYAIVIESHVRDAMNLATLSIYL